MLVNYYATPVFLFTLYFGVSEYETEQWAKNTAEKEFFRTHPRDPFDHYYDQLLEWARSARYIPS
jgi:hypothetical protein